MSKPDENRRRLLKLTGGVLAGGSLLYAEEIREYLSGEGQEDRKPPSDTTTVEPPNGRTSTDRPHHTTTTTGATDTPTGDYRPRNTAYELSDREMESFADWLDGEGYEDRSRAVYNWVMEDGSTNQIYWSDGTPEIETGIYTETPNEAEVDDEKLYKLLEEWSQG